MTLISRLIIDNDINKGVYDPFCRFGEVLAGTVGDHKEIVHVAGDAQSLFGYKMTLLKSFMLYFPESDIKNQSIYDRSDVEKFDCIVANPPFGGKPPRYIYQNAGEWLNTFGGVRQELDYFSHILDHLNDKGQAIVIVPGGLSSSSGKIQQFRQKLIEENMLEAVIHLPARTFYQTGVSTAIFCVNSNKKQKEILLVNAAVLGIRQRDRHILSDNDISDIVDLIELFRNGKKEDREAEVFVRVTIEELKGKGFDLQFTTHATYEANLLPTMAPSEKIWKEIQRLCDELKENQEKISRLKA